MEGYDLIYTGAFSVLPPLLAIVLALRTKEVYSSLVIGIVSGLVIYGIQSGMGALHGLFLAPRLMAEQMANNAMMILFLSLLFATVTIVTMAGGSQAYGVWACRHIGSAKQAKLYTALLGLLIFVDDGFNCLTVGTIMQPVTDRFRISRAKLAWIIDSTAAPICIISPISSWSVAVAAYLGEEQGLKTFVQIIPYNLYAILTLVLVFLICLLGLDFGPMKREEEKAGSEKFLREEEQQQDLAVEGKGRVTDLVIPILTLVICSVFGMAYAGGFFQGIDFLTAIGENPTCGFSLGAMAALLVAAFMYLPRKLMTISEFMQGFIDGVRAMIPAMMILILAWSLSAVCRYMIGSGVFISHLVEVSGVSLEILPAFIFLIAAMLSFSMGTAWGTFGILLPIVLSICEAEGGAAVLLISMGATLAGSVFGDHCSPISDTTILSSTGAGCQHLVHVSTQLPYAVLVAGVSFIGYLLSVVIFNPWIVLAISVCLLFSLLMGIHYIVEKRGKNTTQNENQ